MSALCVDRVTANDPAVAALLMRHHALMRASSSEEACHVLSVAELLESGTVLFACREGEAVFAVGGLKVLTAELAELKSMHTAQEARGKGAGRAILVAILAHARTSGCPRISLETGTAELFAPARALYAAHGFVACAPFGDYVAHPESTFMTLAL